MKRTLALGAAWTASAAAAVGLGFLAVSLVDASASPGTQPQAATGTTTSAAPSATPTATPVASTGQMATVGGTVFADCTSGTPVVAGVPAAGWWADDSPKPGEAEFENGTLKVEVLVSCVGGGPVFRMEGPRADDSGGGSPSTSSSAPSSTDAPDDSDGRGGGGHGSDDSGGDDSSGRGGGGHGSDD